ncbi:hypothetical protein NL676_035520 [Syzygium grande]|nr:hypothetical protein NL676_035520 [Syzygium grande]
MHPGPLQLLHKPVGELRIHQLNARLSINGGLKATNGRVEHGMRCCNDCSSLDVWAMCARPMARHLNGFTFLAVATVAATMALLSGYAAQTTVPPPEHPKGTVTYTVGDAMGWTIPAGGAAAYQAWASSNIFEVGDILGELRNDSLV